jgi:hypothetical protein
MRSTMRGGGAVADSQRRADRSARSAIASFQLGAKWGA